MKTFNTIFVNIHKKKHLVDTITFGVIETAFQCTDHLNNVHEFDMNISHWDYRTFINNANHISAYAVQIEYKTLFFGLFKTANIKDVHILKKDTTELELLKKEYPEYFV